MSNNDKPSLMAELFDPFHFGNWMKERNVSSPESAALHRDLVMKALGGVILAGAFQGTRMLRSGKADPDNIPSDVRKSMDRQRAARFVSVPSSGTLDLVETLRDMERRDPEGREFLKSHEKAAGDGPLAAVGDVAHRTLRVLPNPVRVYKGMAMTPSWHAPAAAALMAAGFIVGSRQFSKSVDARKKESKKRDIENINRQIGRLVDMEVARTRGHQKVSEKKSLYRQMVDMIGQTGPFLGALGTALIIAGGYAGYKRGSAESESKAIRKAMRESIEAGRAERRPPMILVPSDIARQGAEKGDEEGTQQRVEMPRLQL